MIKATDTYVKQIELIVKNLMSSILIDDQYIPLPNLDAYVNYNLEYLAYQITASLKVPAKVLQDDSLVAQYPDGLWQHIRQKLGLKARMVQIRANEWLTFPTIEVPPLKSPMRIYYHLGASTVDFRKSADE